VCKHLVIPHPAPLPDATRAAEVVPIAAFTPVAEGLRGGNKGAHGDHTVPLALQPLLYQLEAYRYARVVQPLAGAQTKGVRLLKDDWPETARTWDRAGGWRSTGTAPPSNLCGISVIRRIHGCGIINRAGSIAASLGDVGRSSRHVRRGTHFSIGTHLFWSPTRPRLTHLTTKVAVVNCDNVDDQHEAPRAPAPGVAQRDVQFRPDFEDTPGRGATLDRNTGLRTQRRFRAVNQPPRRFTCTVPHGHQFSAHEGMLPGAYLNLVKYLLEGAGQYDVLLPGAAVSVYS
jgi:hypothetical protein